MAEYYHILNYEELSPVYIAVLLSGLRNESRVQMARSGQKANIEQILLATIADEISGLLWRGQNDRPESLLALLIKDKPKNDKKCMSFNKPENFIDW